MIKTILTALLFGSFLNLSYAQDDLDDVQQAADGAMAASKFMYDSVCAICHGDNGKGIEGLGTDLTACTTRCEDPDALLTYISETMPVNQPEYCTDGEESSNCATIVLPYVASLAGFSIDDALVEAGVIEEGQEVFGEEPYDFSDSDDDDDEEDDDDDDDDDDGAGSIWALILAASLMFRRRR